MSILLRSTKVLRIPNILRKRSLSTMAKFDIKSPTITLNETETKIANVLKDYVNWKNSGIKEDSKKLELRITGGWVRDKLLGHESNDLDIAINTQYGEEFADGLRSYLSENFERYGIKPSNIHKIEKNPEKSKHLETATTKLYGLDIDFVNLRNEEYTDESRIPVIKFGTPEEDALRRDATLNALFYNIQKDQVEDFTGSGLQDLAAGILRTPLAPLQTFLDDPLRALRLIRFASRFNFQIADNTLEAMKEDRIKDALLFKISRERVGVELEKMFTGPNPGYGLQLLSDTKLYQAVFNFGSFQNAVFQLNNPHEIKEVFETVERSTYPSVYAIQHTDYSTSRLKTVISRILSDKHLKKLFWILVVLRPWSNISVANLAKKPQQKIPAPELIIKEGLKYSKADSQIITRTATTKDQFQCIVSRLPDYKRSEIGSLLKKYEENVDLAIVFNLFDEVINTGSFESVITKYESFYEIVHHERLEKAYEIKPIIDGKVVSKKLGRKPGPWMSKIMDAILIWQLDNPQLGEDECIEYVKTIIDDC